MMKTTKRWSFSRATKTRRRRGSKSRRRRMQRWMEGVVVGDARP